MSWSRRWLATCGGCRGIAIPGMRIRVWAYCCGGVFADGAALLPGVSEVAEPLRGLPVLFHLLWCGDLLAHLRVASLVHQALHSIAHGLHWSGGDAGTRPAPAGITIAPGSATWNLPMIR